MASLNARYITTRRGIIKMLQILSGFVVCSLLCMNRYNGKSCFSEGRIGFAGSLNFVIVIINVALFLLNIFNLSMWKWEQIYSIIATILFFTATVLLIWYIAEHSQANGTTIISTVLTAAQWLLFLWDIKILQDANQ